MTQPSGRDNGEPWTDDEVTQLHELAEVNARPTSSGSTWAAARTPYDPRPIKSASPCSPDRDGAGNATSIRRADLRRLIDPRALRLRRRRRHTAAHGTRL
jgi:hypothetical protein